MSCVFSRFRTVLNREYDVLYWLREWILGQIWLRKKSSFLVEGPTVIRKSTFSTNWASESRAAALAAQRQKAAKRPSGRATACVERSEHRHTSSPAQRTSGPSTATSPRRVGGRADGRTDGVTPEEKKKFFFEV